MAGSDGKGQRPGAQDGPPTIEAAPLRPLSLLNEVAIDELGAQERRADALDSKAGVLLGFAGVLVGLSVDKLQGGLGYVATGAAAMAGLLASAAFIPRSYPTLALRRLRDSYLTAQEEFTRLRLLDTRIGMYQRNQPRLAWKAQLVRASTVVLGAAVLLTVVASIVQVDGKEVGGERKQGTTTSTSTSSTTSTTV
jgi:hypothetical protein